MKIIEIDEPDRYGEYPCCWASGKDATPQKIHEWLFNHYQGYKFAIIFDCTKDEFEERGKETPVYFADGILNEILHYAGLDAVKRWIGENTPDDLRKLSCADCKWQGKRHQKCTCCIRNTGMKDIYSC